MFTSVTVNEIAAPNKPCIETARGTSTTSTLVNMKQITKTMVNTGIRVTVDVPFASDDARPLFLIRNGPFIPQMLAPESTTDQLRAWANALPVMPAISHLESDPLPPVYVSQFAPPPALAELARIHKAWIGSMIYNIKITCNVACTGQLIIAPLYGTDPLVPNTDSSLNYSAPFLPYFDPNAGMQNSAIEVDLSNIKHALMTVPFQYPVHYYDQYTVLGNYQALDGDRLQFQRENLIAVYARGSINANALSKIVFEIDYCCGDDFSFYGMALPGSPLFDCTTYPPYNFPFFTGPPPTPAMSATEIDADIRRRIKESQKNVVPSISH